MRKSAITAALFVFGALGLGACADYPYNDGYVYGYGPYGYYSPYYYAPYGYRTYVPYRGYVYGDPLTYAPAPAAESGLVTITACATAAPAVVRDQRGTMWDVSAEATTPDFGPGYAVQYTGRVAGVAGVGGAPALKDLSWNYTSLRCPAG